ncbi:MAG: hypothetical protein ABIZ80_14990, partial [Bryobacteraceae bacterium]
MKFARLLLPLCLGTMLSGHPMGNFSVSHYTRIEVTGRGAAVLYVLDLAEIPTFELFQQWKLDRNSPRAELERRATGQARDWVRNLKITVDGRAMVPQFERAELAIADGAGALPVARIAAHLKLPVAAGKLEFEDTNFAERAGWKEIVIRAGEGAAVTRATETAQERSQGLTAYPQDPTVAPPQDLRAAVEWTLTAPAVSRTKSAPVAAPIPQPLPVPPPAERQAEQPATASTPAGTSAPGTVVRGDFLSQMLHNREITFGMTLIGLAVAFGLGAVHALSPGHGKTIVAAYLVGARGTARHAIFLGGMVTFT